MGGAKREAVGSKVGVHAVEAAGQNIILVALLDNEGEENPIVRRASDAPGAFSCEKLRPGLRRGQVGVVDVKERQDFSCAGPESVKGSMFSIPVKKKAFKMSQNYDAAIIYLQWYSAECTNQINHAT